MAPGQVNHMDIVPHAGAVVGVVIVAEHVQILPPAHRHLGDEGHQVVGDAPGILADQAAGMGADGVEVAQQDDGPVLVGLGGVPQDLLGHIFGPAIGIGAHAGAGGLPQRHLVVPGVDGGRGGEHDVLNAVIPHHLAQRYGGEKIVVVILKGHGHRLAHGLKPREVDHAVDLVLIEDGVHGLPVAHVLLIEVHMLAGDLLHALNGLRAGVDQVVHHHNAHVLLQKLNTGVASDVSGAAGDKYVHCFFLLSPAELPGTRPDGEAPQYN